MPITGVPSTIAAIYTTAAGQSIANVTETVVDFGTKVQDTHDAVTTGAAWRFTAPTAGFYQVSARVLFTYTTGWADGEVGSLRILVNGAGLVYLDRKDNYGSASSNFMQLGGSALVYLGAGDYLEVRALQGSGAALALYNVADYNYISVAKV